MYLRGWQSFQPGQIPLGKAGAAAVCDDARHPLKTTPMWHPRGPHGQRRQPHHSCCQLHRVSVVPPAITEVRASLAPGDRASWGGLVCTTLRWRYWLKWQMKWQISLSKNLPTKRNGNIQNKVWQVFCYFEKSPNFHKLAKLARNLSKKCR